MFKSVLNRLFGKAPEIIDPSLGVLSLQKPSGNDAPSWVGFNKLKGREQLTHISFYGDERGPALLPFAAARKAVDNLEEYQEKIGKMLRELDEVPAGLMQEWPHNFYISGIYAHEDDPDEAIFYIDFASTDEEERWNVDVVDNNGAIEELEWFDLTAD